MRLTDPPFSAIIKQGTKSVSNSSTEKKQEPRQKRPPEGETLPGAKRRIKMCTNLGRRYSDDSLENHCGLELWSVTETLLQAPHSCLLAHRPNNKH